jgi:hypothetical protein
MASRIAEKMKRMPRVDFNGRDLPPATADPSVISIVDAAAPTVPTVPAPNPAQGVGGGASVPAPTAGGSTLDRITAELTRKLAPPLPEGYTPAPPR